MVRLGGNQGDSDIAPGRLVKFVFAFDSCVHTAVAPTLLEPPCALEASGGTDRAWTLVSCQDSWYCVLISS